MTDININDNWKFHLGDKPDATSADYDDSEWRILNLPHDWSIELPFDANAPSGGQGAFLCGGIGWYRKKFVLSESDSNKIVSIQFGGIYMDSTVFVNGTFVGQYPFGYSPIAYNISKFIIADGVTENIIAVKVVNKQPSSRWYSGSGIYRAVKLLITDKIHFSRYGIYITTPDLETHYEKSSAIVRVSAKAVNDSDFPMCIAVNNTIYDSRGNIFCNNTITEYTIIQPHQSLDFTQFITTPKPNLWSVSNPNLYSLVSEIISQNRVIENFTTTFGFRYFKFDSNDGFSLNGEHLKFQGVCMHHDNGALGSVENYTACERKLRIMKKMGVNAIRSSHNPASYELLDLCNKLGIMLIEEGFDAWWAGKVEYDAGRFFEKPATHPDALPGQKWCEFDIQNMVNRSKNEPCIIMWSLGNEIQQIREDKALDTAIMLKNAILKTDNTRIITMGDSFIQIGYPFKGAHRDVCSILDAIGFNYGSFEMYDKAHAENPNWAIFGSEISSAIRSRGIYAHPYSEGIGDEINHPDLQFSSYDNDRVIWGTSAAYALKNDRERKWFGGEFIWTGFDYLGEPSHYKFPAKSSYFGTVDTAGFPKDAYFLYMSQWTNCINNPMIHILPHWNWDNDDTIKHDGKILVVVYTNAPKAELFLNGNSLGEKSFNATDSKLWLEWEVPYKHGTLNAYAKKSDGEIISEDTVCSSEEPYKIKLIPEKKLIAANGNDLAYIAVQICDKYGITVPTSTNKIKFEVSGYGEIAGVDNGNPACIESFKADTRSAFAGKALLILRSINNKSGSINISAHSDGLLSDSVSILSQSVVIKYSNPIVKTARFTPPVLPLKLNAAFEGGASEYINVAWDEIDPAKYCEYGKFSVSGHVENQSLRPTVTVIVNESIAVQNYSCAVPLNVKPKLPDQLLLYGSDENITVSDVTWADYDPSLLTKENTFTVTGTVGNLTAYASVRVSSDTVNGDNHAQTKSGFAWPLAMSYYSNDINSVHHSYCLNDGNPNTIWSNLNCSNNTLPWIGVIFGVDTPEKRFVDNFAIDFVSSESFEPPLQYTIQYYKGTMQLSDIPKNHISHMQNLPHHKFNLSQNWQDVQNLTKEFTFDMVETYALRIIMKPSDNAAIAISDIRAIEKRVKLNTSFKINNIYIGNEKLISFDENIFDYTLPHNTDFTRISIDADNNAAVSVIHLSLRNTILLLIVSEDGLNKKTYTMQLDF